VLKPCQECETWPVVVSTENKFEAKSLVFAGLTKVSSDTWYGDCLIREYV